MQFIPDIPEEFLADYQAYDRRFTIRKTRLGCILGIVMVPLFGWLDHYAYPQQQVSFFLLRLLCAALMAGLYFVLGTSFGERHYHFQGLVLLFLPSATIAWMVYATEGTASPYYAGLTLVLMVLAVVLDWTLWQSIVSVLLVLALYLAACLFSTAKVDTRLFINHLFFPGFFRGCHHRRHLLSQPRAGAGIYFPQRTGQEQQGARSQPPTAQGKRNATGAIRKARVVGAHERRHHP